ncbi:MAG: glycoside hydrolase family 2 protein [Sphaerochaetaceae bacterium]|nr:glycoside hydrolase family 2 protein [Sphaerochaetaceae bacterium]
MRTILQLNDNWFFKKTSDIPVKLPADWEKVSVPHTWNAEDGQDGGNDYWRGTACYARKLENPVTSGRVYLEVNGAAMSCSVYLNGKELNHHDGGYSTFRTDLTPYLEKENILCLTVDNSENDRVYPQKADFTFYGGLYRNVNLVAVPDNHFELVKDGTPGIKVTPVVSPDRSSAEVTVQTWQNSGTVTFTLDGCTEKCVSHDGMAQAVFTIKNVHLWDGLDDPYLYTVTAELDSGDKISTRFGCRTMDFDPEKGFILNGRVYPLRGVSRHQDRQGLGNAITEKEHREDMEIIRECGANTIRLAHYQHAQFFYDLCDEYGMVVWAEIPYITEHMPKGRQNTLDQMRELITQCYNHPSICCWGLSNEIAVHGVTDDLMENHVLLNDLCHSMDKTRPTTMAHAFMLEQENPLVNLPDIASYNLYFGWYLGTLEQNDSFFDEYHSKYPDRMMGFSEYGADANVKFHSSHPEAGDYTEEYQCVYHEYILSCIERHPWFWATHAWNLFDFAADGRDEGGNHGLNQKGCVSFDRTYRKDAYYLYKATWNKKDEFIHLCGKRYKNRAEDETEVKVYTNRDKVTLFVNGQEKETVTGKAVFRFKVQLEEKTEIKVVSGDLSDEMVLFRVSEPDKSYILEGGTGSVSNWFDEEGFKTDHFSVRDTLGTLRAHPEASVIAEGFMNKLVNSRGDVAKSAGENKNLQKMLNGMSFESILKKAALPPEMVQNLNDQLQKIKK